MKITVNLLRNGYLPIIPILLWNYFLVSKLPSAFQPESFNANIPEFILIGENVFRTIIFILPLCFQLNTSTDLGRKGLWLYLTGTALYFGSWVIQIAAANSMLATSLLGFIAPAYTPLIWLLGLALMADRYYVKLAYSRWHFILPTLAFSAFHISHTLIVFNRT